MKKLKTILFGIICGGFSMTMRIIAQHTGIFAGVSFGFIEGMLIAFTLLKIEWCKEFFMGK